MTATLPASLGKFLVRYKNRRRKFKTFQGEVFPSKHGDNHILMVLDPAATPPEELKDGESVDKPIYRTLIVSRCLKVNPLEVKAQ